MLRFVEMLYITMIVFITFGMLYVYVCDACGENIYACEFLCVYILLCNLDLVVISHPSAGICFLWHSAD